MRRGVLQEEHKKRLEFNNTSLCVYSGHKLLINNVFFNPNIQTFVSLSEKSLHSWNPENLEVISAVNFNETDQDHPTPITQISCICYSKKYFLYFACSNDFKLIVFNEHFNLVKSQPMPVGLVQTIHFYDHLDQLITGGRKGLFIIDLHIKFRYEPRMAILLDPKGQSITVSVKQIQDQPYTDHIGLNDLDQYNLDQFDVMPVAFEPLKYGNHIKQLQCVTEWVNGVRLFEGQNLIAMWKKDINIGPQPGKNDGGEQNNQIDQQMMEGKGKRVGEIKETNDQIVFYSLKGDLDYKQGEVWGKYFDPAIRDDFVTDLLVFKDQKLFVTAHYFGDIHLRKLSELNSLDNDTRMEQGQTSYKSVHVFKGHSQTVTSLAPVSSKKSYFVSASLDGKVRIWDIEKMIELYCFDIILDSPVHNSAQSESIVNVKLINDGVYALVFKSNIEIGLISHLLSSFFITQQEIKAITKCYDTHSKCVANKPWALSISFTDNSVVLLDPVEKQSLCTIYPPPTPAEVTHVVYIQCIRRIVLLLKTGTLCVYNVESETGLLELLQEQKQLKDYDGKGVYQQITSISKCYTEPPQFDCEIFSDLKRYKPPESPEYPINPDPDGGPLDQFLVLGLSKGTIVFVKVNDFGHIYSRFSVHRQAVTHISEIWKHRLMLSICEELTLTIWSFNNQKDQVFQKTNLQKPVFTMVSSELEQILICFQEGEQELILWDDQLKQIKRLPVEKTDDHEDRITCSDVLHSTGLYVTGDEDGLIKVWNGRKQLIRDIKFVETVNSVAFLNDMGDIIVGHSGNISRLDASQYMIKNMVLSKSMVQKHYSEGKLVSEFFFKDKPLTLQQTLPPKSAKHTATGSNRNMQSVRRQESPQKQDINVLNPAIGFSSFTSASKNALLKIGPTMTSASPSAGQISNRKQVRNQNHIKKPSVSIKNEDSLQTTVPQQIQMGKSLSESVSDREPIDLKKKLVQLRRQCALGPSIPTQFQKAVDAVNYERKQMEKAANCSRRTMTEERIIMNIQQRNDPGNATSFNDILVPSSQSRANAVFVTKIVTKQARRRNLITNKQFNKQMNNCHHLTNLSRSGQNNFGESWTNDIEQMQLPQTREAETNMQQSFDSVKDGRIIIKPVHRNSKTANLITSNKFAKGEMSQGVIDLNGMYRESNLGNTIKLMDNSKTSNHVIVSVYDVQLRTDPGEVRSQPRSAKNEKGSFKLESESHNDLSNLVIARPIQDSVYQQHVGNNKPIYSGGNVKIITTNYVIGRDSPGLPNDRQVLESNLSVNNQTKMEERSIEQAVTSNNSVTQGQPTASQPIGEYFTQKQSPGRGRQASADHASVQPHKKPINYVQIKQIGSDELLLDERNQNVPIEDEERSSQYRKKRQIQRSQKGQSTQNLKKEFRRSDFEKNFNRDLGYSLDGKIQVKTQISNVLNLKEKVIKLPQFNCPKIAGTLRSSVDKGLSHQFVLTRLIDKQSKFQPLPIKKVSNLIINSQTQTRLERPDFSKQISREIKSLLDHVVDDTEQMKSGTGNMQMTHILNDSKYSNTRELAKYLQSKNVSFTPDQSAFDVELSKEAGQFKKSSTSHSPSRRFKVSQVNQKQSMESDGEGMVEKYRVSRDNYTNKISNLFQQSNNNINDINQGHLVKVKNMFSVYSQFPSKGITQHISIQAKPHTAGGSRRMKPQHNLIQGYQKGTFKGHTKRENESRTNVMSLGSTIQNRLKRDGSTTQATNGVLTNPMSPKLK